MSIEVDSRNVGRIIGMKGATINQLQSEYNVKITIAKDDYVSKEIRILGIFDNNDNWWCWIFCYQ